ncbi:hypothetical protein [Streptomyces sp. bgisy060]|uniref:hypothetical protein n=1 Tax=Streptomyces sp. bgisy060 TaxID=3413775 RepID=UPI003EBE9630
MNQTIAGSTTRNAGSADSGGREAAPALPLDAPEDVPAPAAPRHTAALPAWPRRPARSGLPVRPAPAIAGSGRALV